MLALCSGALRRSTGALMEKTLHRCLDNCCCMIHGTFAVFYPLNKINSEYYRLGHDCDHRTGWFMCADYLLNKM